ncbi:hypothetical protein ZWY2020_019251 [Hordeum vulgare]|nr:hypothetical protein ZWY2020_019251 [Hordeum vulgare]
MATGGSADTWAELRRHNYPGHSTDGVVIDRPERKKAVAARAEELAPPADRVAKPARRGYGSARRRWKKTAPAPAATVDRRGEMQTYGRHEKEARTTVHDGRDRYDKKTPAAPRRWGDEEASEYEEEEEAEFVMVGGVRCRRTAATGVAEEEEAEFILVGGVLCPTVAPRSCKVAVAGGITIGGTNMRDLLRGNGPGHVVHVVDGRKHEKVAAAVVQVAVEETPSTASVAEKHETAPAAIVDDGGKVQNDGAAENKEASVPDVDEQTDGRENKEMAPTAIVDDGSKVQTDGSAEDKQVTAVPDGEEVTDGREEEAAEEEMSKEEAEKKFIDVVTTGGSRCPTVARRTSTAAVAGGITVGGANMWAVLCDHDPGHGARDAKPAKRRKRTKKNKKRAAEDNKQADAVEDVDDIVAEEVAAATVVEVVEAPPTASVAKNHETAPAAIVDDGSKVQTDGAAEDKEDTVPDVEEVTDGREEKETAPAAIVDDGGKVQTDSTPEIKVQATTVPDDDEVIDGENEKETVAVSPGDEEVEEAAEEEMSKEEEENKFMDVVTTGGSGCQTVTKRTSTAAVAGGITIGGANMWAALCDHDPGQGAGGTKPAKRGKKTKKNKKRVAEDSKQADAVDDGVVQIGSGHEEQETPAELPIRPTAVPSKKKGTEKRPPRDPALAAKKKAAKKAVAAPLPPSATVPASPPCPPAPQAAQSPPIVPVPASPTATTGTALMVLDQMPASMDDEDFLKFTCGDMPSQEFFHDDVASQDGGEGFVDEPTNDGEDGV